MRNTSRCVLQKFPARNTYHATLLNDYIFTIGQYCRIQELAVSISDDEPRRKSHTIQPIEGIHVSICFAVKVRL